MRTDRRGGKANVRVKPHPNPPEILPLQAAAQVRDFIAQVKGAARAFRYPFELRAGLLSS